jgi:hypothetical protein
MAGIVVAAVGLLVPTLIFLPDFLAYTGLSLEVFMSTFVLTVILSLAVIGIVSVRYKEWRSYAVGAVFGQILGAALLSVIVVAVSPLFLTYFTEALPAWVIIPLFVWTFATEVPFVLLLGPPIIKAANRAFPSLRRNRRQ